MSRAMTVQDKSREQSRAIIAELRRPSVQQSLGQLVPTSMQKVLTPARIERLLLTACQRQPQLLDCTPASLVRSTLELVTLGLDPSGVLGDGYLVPFWNGTKRCLEAQGIPGYRGLIAIARRSGEILSVNAQVVYDQDLFEIDLAGGDIPRHRPGLPKRGEPIAVYCVARFRGEGHHVEYMTVDDVNGIRDRSQGYKQAIKKGHDRNPWITDWGQMARKTVIRRACHYWPMSTELASAFAMDDKHERALETGVVDVIDTTGEIVATYREDDSGAPAEQPAEQATEAPAAEPPAERSAPSDDVPPPPPDTSAETAQAQARQRATRKRSTTPAAEPAQKQGSLLGGMPPVVILEQALKIHDDLISKGLLTAAKWADWCQASIGKKRPTDQDDIERLTFEAEKLKTASV